MQVYISVCQISVCMPDFTFFQGRLCSAHAFSFGNSKRLNNFLYLILPTSTWLSSSPTSANLYIKNLFGWNNSLQANKAAPDVKVLNQFHVIKEIIQPFPVLTRKSSPKILGRIFLSNTLMASVCDPTSIYTSVQYKSTDYGRLEKQ